MPLQAVQDWAASLYYDEHHTSPIAHRISWSILGLQPTCTVVCMVCAFIHQQFFPCCFLWIYSYFHAISPIPLLLNVTFRTLPQPRFTAEPAVLQEELLFRKQTDSTSRRADSIAYLHVKPGTWFWWQDGFCVMKIPRKPKGFYILYHKIANNNRFSYSLCIHYWTRCTLLSITDYLQNNCCCPIMVHTLFLGYLFFKNM